MKSLEVFSNLCGNFSSIGPFQENVLKRVFDALYPILVLRRTENVTIKDIIRILFSALVKSYLFLLNGTEYDRMDKHITMFMYPAGSLVILAFLNRIVHEH